MDIQALQLTLREFAAQRHWQPFHTPKNLSTALMVEAAELLEIFQWMTPEESQAAHLNPDTQAHIADEVADVLLYLLQVADHCHIDLPVAVTNKLVKNAIKHPAAQQAAESTPSPANVPALPLFADPAATAPQGSTDQPADIESPEPQTHVLVDWENVQPKAQDIQALVPSVTDVWLFHGPNQRNVAVDQTSFGQRATLVPIARTGKNALDFHLSFYMGYIASRNPQGNMVVISNDKGYLPMVEHAQTLGFSVRQAGFVKAEGKKPTPRKVAVKPKVTAIVAPASALETEAMAEVVPLNEQKRELQAQNTKPVKQAARQKSVPSQVALPASPAKATPTQQLAVLQSGTTPLPTPPAKAAKKTVAAKKAPATKKVPTPSKATTKTVKNVPKQAKPKVATKPAVTKAAAKKTPSTHPLPQKQKKPLVSLDLDKAVRHVQASLQKMASKPTRKARLLATIKSLLNLSDAEAHIVPEVLTRLVELGFIVVSENGAVRFST